VAIALQWFRTLVCVVPLCVPGWIGQAASGAHHKWALSAMISTGRKESSTQAAGVEPGKVALGDLMLQMGDCSKTFLQISETRGICSAQKLGHANSYDSSTGRIGQDMRDFAKTFSGNTHTLPAGFETWHGLLHHNIRHANFLQL